MQDFGVLLQSIANLGYKLLPQLYISHINFIFKPRYSKLSTRFSTLSTKMYRKIINFHQTENNLLIGKLALAFKESGANSFFSNLGKAAAPIMAALSVQKTREG